jgi:hypothetical protein
MSAFYNIRRTLLTEVDALSLSFSYYVENQNFDPPKTGIHGVVSFLSNVVDSAAKGTTGAFDENSGVMQISLFDADTGLGAKNILDAADEVAAGFRHGDVLTAFETVYIQNTQINTPRIQGGFFQLDASISWYSYVDR